jgi:plastocyanin
MEDEPVSFTKAPLATRRAANLSTLALTLGAIAVSGCGSSKSKSSSSESAAPAPTSSSASTPAAPAGATKLKIAANSGGQLKFEPGSLSGKAGTVSIEFTNSSSIEHNFTLASSSGGQVGATPTFTGATKALTVSLKAGTYKFYCTVPGHRAAGMEGTLTLQ